MHAEDADVMVRGAAARPRTFFTRAITDPGLIPLLIARGVSFRAVQVSSCSPVGLTKRDGCSLPVLRLEAC